MAIYKARPFYEIKVGKQTVVFDYFGEYATEDAGTIAALDKLVPAYIRRTDESVAAKAEQMKTTEAITEDKPKARKSSAK